MERGSLVGPVTTLSPMGSESPGSLSVAYF